MGVGVKKYISMELSSLFYETFHRFILHPVLKITDIR